MNRPAIDQKVLVISFFLFISLTATPKVYAETETPVANDTAKSAAATSDRETRSLNEFERADLEVKRSQLVLLSVSPRNVERVIRAEKRLYKRTRDAEARNAIRPKSRKLALDKLRLHHEDILKKILGESTYAVYEQSVRERARETKIVTSSHVHGARTRFEGAPPERQVLEPRAPSAFQASVEGSDGW